MKSETKKQKTDKLVKSCFKFYQLKEKLNRSDKIIIFLQEQENEK